MNVSLQNIINNLIRIQENSWDDKNRESTYAINSKIDLIINEIVRLIELQLQ